MKLFLRLSAAAVLALACSFQVTAQSSGGRQSAPEMGGERADRSNWGWLGLLGLVGLAGLVEAVRAPGACHFARQHSVVE